MMALTEIKKVADLDTPDTDPTIGRRRFLQWGIYGLGGAITAALAVPAIGYFIAPATAGNSSKVEVPVGNLKDFANATDPKFVSLTYNYLDEFKQGNGPAPLFVRAAKPNPTQASDIQVISAVCTHLNCIVKWTPQDKLYECPCHGSQFAPDGTRVAGPASKALNKYDVILDSATGQISINPLQSFA